MKETLASTQENQSNKQNKKNSEEYSGKQEDDKTMNVVVNKIHNNNKIEIILKHNDESLMQLLVEINKNDNSFNLSIFNTNKQRYEFNVQCDIKKFSAQCGIKNDIIISIVCNNKDEIKRFIACILIDLLKINYPSIISLIAGHYNIKIDKYFDIDESKICEDRNKIAKKIANAEIVIQENQPSAQQPNIQEQSGNIIQNISQWCLQNCCCCLNK